MSVVAHALAVITVQAGVGRCLAGKRPEKASAALESIETISRTAQDELRVVLGLLRDGEAAHPPTAVVIANIASAIGAVRAAHLAGMHVPAQVSVVSVHDLPPVGYLEPRSPPSGCRSKNPAAGGSRCCRLTCPRSTTRGA